MLDRNLSWNDHIDCIGRKISAKLGMIRKASKVIPRESCLTRYNALILPVFDYCAARMGQLVIQFSFRRSRQSHFLKLKKKIASFVNSKRDKDFLCCVKWMYYLILDVNEFLDTNCLCMTMHYHSVCIAWYNYLWLFRTMTDYVCLFKMFYGYIWLCTCLTMYDCVMVMYGFVAFCMLRFAMYDYVWQCLTLYS